MAMEQTPEESAKPSLQSEPPTLPPQAAPAPVVPSGGGSVGTLVIEPVDLYKLYRSRIEQQSGLLTQRVSVVIPLQAALLAVWGVIRQDVNNSLTRFHNLEPAIPVVALCQLTLAFLGANACLQSIRALEDHFSDFDNRLELARGTLVNASGQKYRIDSYVGDRNNWKKSVLPPLTSKSTIHLVGHYASLFVIVLLILTWLLFLGSMYLSVPSR